MDRDCNAKESPELMRDGVGLLSFGGGEYRCDGVLNFSDFAAAGLESNNNHAVHGKDSETDVLNFSDFGVASPESANGHAVQRKDAEMDVVSAIENAEFLIPTSSSSILLCSTPMLAVLPNQKSFQVLEGSPGHTPFPHKSFPRPKLDVNAVPLDQVSPSECCAKSMEGDDESVSSMPPPPVPFNSPDDAELMEALKNEAKKQESEIKERMEGRNLMEIFKISPPSHQEGGGQPSQSAKSRKRRNRKDLCSGMSVQELEKLSNEKKITEYHTPMSVNEKEVRRRNRISSSICMLRKIVPGITEDTENTDVYETSAKYILYLKQKVGTAYDAEFLSELLPL